MKLPKWAIVAVLLAIAAGSAAYEAKLYLEKKKHLENLVVQAVSPYINGSFQVGRVRFGFFSAHLNDVKVQLPAQALGITIEDLRVTFSLIKLVRSGFSINRSIEKIVLFGPRIEILLVPPPHPAGASATASATASAMTAGKSANMIAGKNVHVAEHLSVEYLSVMNGIIRLADQRGRITVLGENLQGRMWNTGTALNYDLTGILGAPKSNLFVSGSFSWRGGKHNMSLKLDNAEVQRPLAFKDFVITAGAVRGALQLAFSDTVSAAGIESTGWFRIDHGRCQFGSIRKPFESVDLSLSVADTRIIIDSASARYSCVSIHANGSWDCAGISLNDRIDFQCRDIWLDSLGIASTAWKAFCPVVGAGWVRGTLERRKGADIELSVNGGGVTVWGAPLLGIFANVKFQNKQLALDSLSLHSPACDIAGTGVIDYSREPVAYSIQCSGSFDSLSLLHPDYRGKLRFSGTVNGVGDERSGQFSCQGKSLRYSGIPFGNAVIKAHAQGDSITFSAHNDLRGCFAKAAGVVRNFLTDRSRAACTLSVKAGSKSPFFAGPLARLPRPELLKAMVFFNGWGNAFHLRLTADAFGRKAKGGVTLSLDRNTPAQRPASSSGGRRLRGRLPDAWKLEQRNLVINNIPFTCMGAGRYCDDSLIIDSLVLLDRTVSSGKILLSRPARMDVVCRYSVAIADLMGVAAKAGTAVESGKAEGVVRLSGPVDKIESRAEIHVRDVKIGGIGVFQTDATVTGSGGSFQVLPTVLRKDGSVIVALDTLSNVPCLHAGGSFSDLDLRAVFGSLLSEDYAIGGRITGYFHSSERGFPVTANITSPRISINEWQFDSVRAIAAFDSTGVRVLSLRACDGPRTVVTASGFVPMSQLQGNEIDRDTIRMAVSAKGDLIATLHRNLTGVIDGSGQGAVTLSFDGQPDNWHVREGSLIIPKGRLFLKPYLRKPIENFSCIMTMNDSSSVTTVMSGKTGKRPVRIFSTHEIPSGYEPIRIGPLDFGVLQIETPQHGLDIHLPGFMEKGETGDLEPTGRNPFRYFSLTGPANALNVVGILLLRDVEFTYPLLEERELPSPSAVARTPTAGSNTRPGILSLIRWEMDIKPYDREVMYFRNISNKSTHWIRFFDAYIEQGASVLRLRGRENDNTLKISGIIKSYHGSVYYGKTFDRSFEAGLEFVPQKRANAPGYDNLPILWGSAEAYSDTSRFNHIKLTAMVQDPKTGALSERGRLVKGHLNVVFHLSSDFEELPGESEREFYRQAGLQFTTLGSAGKFMSDFGEQNLHRILLQRFERKLAKSIGLDVINIETSIASNYFTRFYNRQFDNQTLQADYLALANVGVTVGRYLFRDNLFLKARGGLLPLDTALTPQYSVGLEFQPTRYLFMDFDYGFYKREMTVEHNPRVNLQLRLPISGLRKFFDF